MSRSRATGSEASPACRGRARRSSPFTRSTPRARPAHPPCPTGGRPIQRQTVQQIVDSILAIPPGRRLLVMAPVIRDRKGEYQKVFEDARKAGFVRVRVDGQVRELEESISLDKNK